MASVQSETDLDGAQNPTDSGGKIRLCPAVRAKTGTVRVKTDLVIIFLKFNWWSLAPCTVDSGSNHAIEHETLWIHYTFNT